MILTDYLIPFMYFGLVTWGSKLPIGVPCGEPTVMSTVLVTNYGDS